MEVSEFPFQVERLPRRRLALGCLISLSGFALLIAVVVVGLAILEEEIVPFWLGLPAFTAALLFAAVSTQRISKAGKKLRQRDALTVLARDHRPPVLFLRSFRDEDVVDLTSRTGRGMRRYEESLCSACHRIGPVVAIGRPSERLPELGAGRLYVSDDHWRGAVRFFMGRAAAIVILVGRSPGVWWEIETALQEAEISRILFFFPYVEEESTRRSFWHGLTPRARVLSTKAFEAMAREREERYRRFRQAVRPDLARALPMTLGQALFLDFSEDGTPRFLETVRPSTFDSLLQASLSNLKIGVHMERTLAPYFDKLVKSLRV